MPGEIVMRHRIPHFQHIMGGYAAGYYSYLWSEVMDADAFKAFEETGDIFDKGIARRLHDHIYSAGGKRDAADAYIAFRGRLPTTRGAAREARAGVACRAVGGAWFVPAPAVPSARAVAPCSRRKRHAIQRASTATR